MKITKTSRIAIFWFQKTKNLRGMKKLKLLKKLKFFYKILNFKLVQRFFCPKKLFYYFSNLSERYDRQLLLSRFSWKKCDNLTALKNTVFWCIDNSFILFTTIAIVSYILSFFCFIWSLTFIMKYFMFKISVSMCIIGVV